MNRLLCRNLAALRVSEAEVLFANGLMSGAYYLAGYAVECGLKACILARVERDGVIFEEKEFSRDCYTHDLDKLLKQAGLKLEHDLYGSTRPAFRLNWLTATRWKEDARYKEWSQPAALELLDAIRHPTDGVLQWIQTHW